MPDKTQKYTARLEHTSSGLALFHRTKIFPASEADEPPLTFTLPAERFRLTAAEIELPTESFMDFRLGGVDVARIGQAALYDELDGQPDVSDRETNIFLRNITTSVVTYSRYRMPGNGLFVAVGSTTRVVIRPDTTTSHFTSMWQIGFNENNGDKATS